CCACYIFLIILFCLHLCLFFFFFFFSSRRRHTRCLSDWSSDVCSSDLTNRRQFFQVYLSTAPRKNWRRLVPLSRMISARSIRARSEERRVGKECRCGWWRAPWKKKYKKTVRATKNIR